MKEKKFYYIIIITKLTKINLMCERTYISHVVISDDDDLKLNERGVCMNDYNQLSLIFN